MGVNLSGRSFLRLLDFSTEEIEYLLQLSKNFKDLKRTGTPRESRRPCGQINRSSCKLAFCLPQRLAQTNRLRATGTYHAPAARLVPGIVLFFDLPG